MAKRVVKKKPSRIRYEQAHPTVSFRIGRPTYGRLKATMVTLGQSFGDWVKEHLDQDDQRVKARAEVLARHRNGLGRDIEGKRQELAKLDWLIQERNKELTAPVGLRRAEMLKEVEAERQRRLKTLEMELLLAQSSRRKELVRLDLGRLRAKRRSHAAWIIPFSRDDWSLTGWIANWLTGKHWWKNWRSRPWR
jgi:hypothetical protein